MRQRGRKGKEKGGKRREGKGREERCGGDAQRVEDDGEIE